MSLGCDSVNYLAFRFSLIAGLIALSGGAMAIGLGELRGSPALGDRPRFEVDILGAGKNLLDPACFRLQRPASDDNLPWLKRAIFTVRQGVPPVLEIVSDAPINDPALSMAIHVGCGQDVVREYMVMVSPPSGRSLMAMEPADASRATMPTPGERIRQPLPETRTSQPAATSAPARLPDPAKVTAPREQHAAELAAAEKIKGMEATVGELQQRAGNLTQKIEEAAAIPATTQSEAKVTSSTPAADQISKMQPAVVPSGGSNSNLYGALIGALLVVAAWLGWRFYQALKQGRQRLEVDPPRKDEREERGGVDLQVDPVAMVMPPRITTDAAGASSATSMEHSVVPPSSHDSTMSIAAPVADEHFEANPVMELAEIMLSFGRVKGAAQALQEYVDANPREALKPWMRLMEVYRMAGMRHEFEKVARELNKNFNVEVQKWDSVAETEGQGIVDVVLDRQLASHRDSAQVEGLEGMPTIIDQVLIRWSAGDVVEYLSQLLRDNRGGTRLGFSLSVVSDILFLIELKETSNKMESEIKAS
jgi:pilus assembly protein FimV